MNKIAFLINPKIRNFKKIYDKILEDFKTYQPECFISNYPRHLIELTSEIINKGFDVLIAVGGDGTLNEVLNGVIFHYKNAEGYNWNEILKIRIGILPAGSGNDFSRNIYPSGRESLTELIKANKTRTIDIGVAQYLDFDKKPTQRFFINITDIGIGGLVAETKSRLPQFIPSGLKYFMSIVYGFMVYRKKNVKIESETYTYTGKILSFTIANGRFFGKGLGIAPQAEIDDGKFALTNIADVNLLDYAIHSRTARKVQKIKHPQVSYNEAVSISIKNTDNEHIEVDLDGEFVGYIPVKINCLKGQITFIG